MASYYSSNSWLKVRRWYKKIMIVTTYRIVVKSHIPIAIRIAINAFMSSRVIGCLVSS